MSFKFKLDDVYIGMLINKVGVKGTRVPGFLSPPEVGKQCAIWSPPGHSLVLSDVAFLPVWYYSCGDVGELYYFYLHKVPVYT